MFVCMYNMCVCTSGQIGRASRSIIETSPIVNLILKFSLYVSYRPYRNGDKTRLAKILASKLSPLVRLSLQIWGWEVGGEGMAPHCYLSSEQQMKFARREDVTDACLWTSLKYSRLSFLITPHAYSSEWEGEGESNFPSPPVTPSFSTPGSSNRNFINISRPGSRWNAADMFHFLVITAGL